MFENEEYKFLTYFEEISQIPRGSGNMDAISQYLVDFAKERGLHYVQDEAKNVIIYKPASKGMENAPTVILQGHMDMVCEKEPGVEHDFLKDPISLRQEGDWLRAAGTTLGADDGVAVAYGLAILDDSKLVHPPLELVITTNEETGMDGAIALDTSLLAGNYLLNIDSEEEGTLLLGCAGGKTICVQLPLRREEIPTELSVVKLTVSGLKGGHSGTEIHKGQANAVRVMGRVLRELLEEEGLKLKSDTMQKGTESKEDSYQLISLEGGNKDNVIPSLAQACLVVKKENISSLQSRLRQSWEVIAEEYQVPEPEMRMETSVVSDGEAKEYLQKQAITSDSLRKLLFFLWQTPNGVVRMNASLPGVVETSLNLGILRSEHEVAKIDFSVRSSRTSVREGVVNQVSSLAKYLGATVLTKSAYPAWEYHEQTEFSKICETVYEEQYGKKPELTVIHAGLECGLLSEKKPELQMVSIGAETLDIHSPAERLSISSAKRVYDYVVSVLLKVTKQ